MKRGFPRPRTLLERPSNYRIEVNQEFQNRTWPHPYSAQDNNLADTKPSRTWECANFKRCQVCGEPVRGEKVWIYQMGGEDTASDSGPYHEKCVRLTQKLCPLVRMMPDVYAFEEVLWKDFRDEILQKNKR